MHKEYVYTISNPVTKKVVYVGVTKNMVARAKSHIASRTPVGLWIRSLQQTGQEPLFTVMSEHDNKTWHREGLEAEAEMIKYMLSTGARLINKPKGRVSKKPEPNIKMNY